ncbi:MAG: hypothetical protein K9N06_09740 [Candidatus Cloacimonetes bacterium]|nr:hypothetical protein [Candidatus Cloacimonadota bacterium]
MKRKVFIVLLMGLLFTAYGKTLVFQSHPAIGNIVMDGLDKEWDTSKVYDDTEKILAGFQHTGETLYFLMISRDPALERQMLMNGFTIWLDDNGKKKKKLGLRFPGMQQSMIEPSGFQENNDERMPRNRNTFAEDMQNRISVPPVFVYFKENKKQEIPYSLNELQNFQFARKYSEEGIIYEFAIPLTRTDEMFFAYALTAQEYISLGLQCNAPKEKHDRMPSGGMPEFSPDEDNDSQRRDFRPQEDRQMEERNQRNNYLIWFKIELPK